MSFSIVIIGRPNVGKSTLFNRLVGRRLAIVHNTPGVTRDLRKSDVCFGGVDFQLTDTAGFEEIKKGVLELEVQKKTEDAVDESDLALLVIDAIEGVTPLDKFFSDYIRKKRKPIILVVNKCEAFSYQQSFPEAYELGLGDPVLISAEHGHGMDSFYESLLNFSKDFLETESENKLDYNPICFSEEFASPLKLAVVGKPNTGKSTLVNYLLGINRMLTGSKPGTTRDSISSEFRYQGRAIRIVDTAGLRKKSKVRNSIEKLSVMDTLKSINMAEVVLLLLDPSDIIDNQDLKIASRVIEEGRSLVIAVNKWDIVQDKNDFLNELDYRLKKSLTQAKNVPTVSISAKNGLNISGLMRKIFETYEIWDTRLTTGQLNKWLDIVTHKHPPPLSSQKRRVRIRYITQAKARPPTFVLFTTRPNDLSESYTRYLINDLREEFNFSGVPIRFLIRKPSNPYVSKD